MPDTISMFSGFNAGNDLIPPDTARDLYQIIASIENKLEKEHLSSSDLIDAIKNHIANHNNPHHLKTIVDLMDSLMSFIYLYYKTYYDGDPPYDQNTLYKLFVTKPLFMLECMRRIQLNAYRWVDGTTIANTSPKTLKNYYTNDLDISSIEFFSTPSYYAGRDISTRNFPYLKGLSDFDGSNIHISTLKDYFTSDTTDPSYGLVISNPKDSARDTILFGWEEKEVGNKDNSNGIWSLVMTPDNKAIFLRPSYDDSQYSIIVKVGNVDDDQFDIACKPEDTYTYLCDKPSCAIVLASDKIGYLSFIKDGRVSRDNAIPYDYTYVGKYNKGKVYSSTLVDDIVPMCIIDPNRNGKPDTNFTPNDTTLTVKMTALEMTRVSHPVTDKHYVPSDKYLADRLPII